ncbi:MAG: phytoene/squalene synthase family protein [Gemmatimonadaceae bacterium]
MGRRSRRFTFWSYITLETLSYDGMSLSDARVCADIANSHARTFALAARLLPLEKRRGAFALYAMCRTADDIVDRVVPGQPLQSCERQLQQFADRVWQAVEGKPAGPIERELAWASARFAIPRTAMAELLDGVGKDLTITPYETWDELRAYCEGVASSVGEMCAAVFGIVDHSRTVQADARRSARTLGVAMQLTNILRDVGEDACRGRCYLPERELNRFGISRADVLSGRSLAELPGWGDAMRLQIRRARELYQESIPGIGLLCDDARGCASACADGYARILEAIEANGFDNLTRRARVAWPTRARVLFNAWRGRSPAFGRNLTAVA